MIDITPDFPIIPSKEKPGGLVVPADQFSAPSGTMVQPKKNDASLGSLFAGASSAEQGSGNDIFRISSLGIQLGNAIFASAPFRVDMQGNLTATSATIIGNITANSGAIGGFDIGADYIRDVANSFGLASTVTGGDDVRFWAGATFANRATAPFRVTEAGVIDSTLGTVGGWTLSSTTLTGGNVILDQANNKITIGSGANMITLNGATGQITTNAGTWVVSGDGTSIGTLSRARAYSSSSGLALNTTAAFRIPFDVESYDGNSEFDSDYRNANMTTGSSSSTLIDSAASFTAADVGKFVFINNGTNAPRLVSTVDSSIQLTLNGAGCADTVNYRLYASQFTAVAAGRYLITANVWFDANAAVGIYPIIYIYVNGGSVSNQKQYILTSVAPNDEFSMQISDVLSLSAGDKVTIWCERGGATIISLVTGSANSNFSVHRLS